MYLNHKISNRTFEVFGFYANGWLWARTSWQLLKVDRNKYNILLILKEKKNNLKFTF